ncbi:MAG TPA: DUF5054 domain-containing protein [Phycisphaerae bacterium]|nr:DUF5054 domain-containing protein [Phycisphaerae bacterium]HRR86768.1 DUF5054 domain-containing protein [Phycisphaerae bacterium]
MKDEQIIRRLCLIAVLLSMASSRLAAQTTSPAQVKEVVVVCKTHFDIGYTDLVSNVLDYYRTTMIDKALAVCDQTRDLPPEQRFVWTLPGWPLSHILGPLQTDARRERIVAMIRESRLVWHALPGTTHTESLELEDLVRGMGFSSRLARQFGQELPRDAKMTDVPSHAWALSTILAQAGVTFLHLGCNRLSTPPDVPVLFWWEGPDGSRVLTMQSPAYGTGLTPPADWSHAAWLALIHTGDNHGPPTPEQIQELLAQAKSELPDVKIRMGRLSDFADAILAEKPDLPVVRADMPDTWIHGIMSMPVESGLARRVRPLIGATESLGTLLDLWRVGDVDMSGTIAEAYEQSFLFGEHTWGLDGKRFPRLYGQAWQDEYDKGTFVKLEQSWGQHAAYIRRVEELIRPTLGEGIRALAAAVNVEGTRIVVFNPLPWSRDDVVSLPWSQATVGKVRDLETGRSVPAELKDEQLSFVAHGVPPLGYRTFVLDSAGTVSPTGKTAWQRADSFDALQVVENPRWRVRIDTTRGTITSLYDKQSDQNLAGEIDGIGLGQFVYERYGADDVSQFLDVYTRGKAPWLEGDFGKPGMPPADQVPHSVFSPPRFSHTIDHGPVSTRIILAAQPSELFNGRVSLTIRLYEDLPFVDFEWKVSDKQATPWPEAGWLCLPLRIDQPVFRLGRLGCVVDPARDVQPSANHMVYALTTGLTLTAPKGKGAGICPIDSPLVCLDERGLWKFSRDFVPKRPMVYVNLFNNQWSTNFVQWIGGAWSCRVRLWPISGTAEEDALVTPAMEARVHCQAILVKGKAGTLPPARAGLTLSRKGVLVTALGPNPDGHGLLLRLWEQIGSDQPCRVQLPDGLRPTSVLPCDLRGRPSGEPIPVKEGVFEVPMTRFAPLSLLIAEQEQAGPTLREE